MDAICSQFNQNAVWMHLAHLLLGYGHREVSSIAVGNNPCFVILEKWMALRGDGATTARLLDSLQSDMQRYDAVDALKNPSTLTLNF